MAAQVGSGVTPQGTEFDYKLVESENCFVYEIKMKDIEKNMEGELYNSMPFLAINSEWEVSLNPSQDIDYCQCLPGLRWRLALIQWFESRWKKAKKKPKRAWNTLLENCHEIDISDAEGDDEDVLQCLSEMECFESIRRLVMMWATLKVLASLARIVFCVLLFVIYMIFWSFSCMILLVASCVTYPLRRTTGFLTASLIHHDDGAPLVSMEAEVVSAKSPSRHFAKIEGEMQRHCSLGPLRFARCKGVISNRKSSAKSSWITLKITVRVEDAERPIDIYRPDQNGSVYTELLSDDTIRQLHDGKARYGIVQPTKKAQSVHSSRDDVRELINKILKSKDVPWNRLRLWQCRRNEDKGLSFLRFIDFQETRTEIRGLDPEKQDADGKTVYWLTFFVEIVPPEMDGVHVDSRVWIIFLKYFDVETEEMTYLGRIYVSPDQTCSHLLREAKKFDACGEGMIVLLHESGDGEVKLLDIDRSLVAVDLISGSVVVICEKPQGLLMDAEMAASKLSRGYASEIPSPPAQDPCTSSVLDQCTKHQTFHTV